MKKLSLMIIAAATAVSFQACKGKQDSTAAADSVNSAKDTSNAVAAGIAADKDDAKFAVEAANGGMAEVALGKLALEKAASAKVKDFGTMMVTDHSKANDELMALAKSRNITLPDSVGMDEKKVMDDLSKKTGSEFDKAYVKNMIADHKKDISLFEDATKNAKDPAIKAFAVKTLPTLKAHLDHINAIHDSMK